MRKSITKTKPSSSSDPFSLQCGDRVRPGFGQPSRWRRGRPRPLVARLSRQHLRVCEGVRQPPLPGEDPVRVHAGGGRRRFGAALADQDRRAGAAHAAAGPVPDQLPAAAGAAVLPAGAAVPVVPVEPAALPGVAFVLSSASAGPSGAGYLHQ